MFSSLRHRSFRRYWIGLFLSNVGSWMQTVAQGWLVLRISDSAFVLGLVVFAGSLPTLVFAPLAGVAADRYDRRSVLLAAQFIQMFSALMLAASTFWGFVTVPLVAALAILSGVANAFMTPSHQSLFLDLVGSDDLMNAIALNSMQFNLSRFARRDALLPPLLGLSMALAVFGTPAVTLAPLYARRLLDAGPQGLGGMLSAVGVGAVATALLLAWLGDFARKGLAVTMAAWAFAISLAGLAVSRQYAFSLASLALLGGAMMCSSSLINTLMQKRAPARLRGRVISLYALAWLGFVPLGNLQAGAVAERFGAAASLWAGAGGIAATLLAIRVFRPIPSQAS
jgi:MFS family permease